MVSMKDFKDTNTTRIKVNGNIDIEIMIYYQGYLDWEFHVTLTNSRQVVEIASGKRKRKKTALKSALREVEKLSIDLNSALRG